MGQVVPKAGDISEVDAHENKYGSGMDSRPYCQSIGCCCGVNQGFAGILIRHDDRLDLSDMVVKAYLMQVGNQYSEGASGSDAVFTRCGPN